MNEAQNTIDQVLHSIESSGIQVPSAGADANVPSDYSSIPDMGEGNIGDLMGALASYINFLEYRVGLAEATYETFNHHYEFEKKRLLLTLPSERRDIMEAKVDTQLLEMSRSVLQKYTEMKLLKTLLDGKKRMFDSLSRELSRRSLVFQMSRGGI